MVWLKGAKKGEELLWFFVVYIQNCKLAASWKIDKNCYVFADSHWKMLLKVIGPPQSTAKKVQKCPTIIGQPLESCWELPQEYRYPMGQCSYLLDVIKKKSANCAGSSYGQKHGNIHPFSLKSQYCLHLLNWKEPWKFKNSQRFFSNFRSFQPYYFLPSSNWCGTLPLNSPGSQWNPQQIIAILD